MLERIASLVERKAPSIEVVMALHDLAHKVRRQGDAGTFWRVWDEAGVDVASHTLGAWGNSPFSFGAAVRGIAERIIDFDVFGGRLVKLLSAPDVRRTKTEGKRGRP